MSHAYEALLASSTEDGKPSSLHHDIRASHAAFTTIATTSTTFVSQLERPMHHASSVLSKLPPSSLSAPLLDADRSIPANVTGRLSDPPRQPAQYTSQPPSSSTRSSLFASSASAAAPIGHFSTTSISNSPEGSTDIALKRVNSDRRREQQQSPVSSSQVSSIMQRILAMYSAMQPQSSPSESNFPVAPPLRSLPSTHSSPLLSHPIDQSQPALTPFLAFRDSSIEPSYRADYVYKYFPTLYMAVLLSTTIWILFVFTDVYKQHVGKRRLFWQTVVMRFGVALLVLVPTWSTMVESVRRRVTAQVMKAALFTYLLLFAACQLAFGVLQQGMLDPTYCDFVILLASMSATTFRLPCFLSMACNTLMCLLFVLLSLTVKKADTDPAEDSSRESPVEAIVWIVVSVVLFSFHGYSVEHSMRSTFLSAQQLSEQELRSQSVLATMLPQRVIHELRTAQGSFVYNHYPDVSVLFSHVHQFDVHTSCLQPRHVVELLNSLFSRFDTLTDQLNVYKVETIGDVYLVSGGVPERMEQHACVLALLAIAMQEEMRLLSLSLQHDLLQPRPLNLQLRIGLHSGPVIAGVVGMKYPRYRLMGDTVNTASRMSTTCQPSQIQMSRATFMQLTEQFVCRYHGWRPVKGKGEMETYMLKYVLPVPGSSMQPISTAEALGKKTAAQVAELLGCAIPTNLLLRQRSSGSIMSSAASPPPVVPSSRPVLTRQMSVSASSPSPARSLNLKPVFHAHPIPGRLYSNARVGLDSAWEADDVSAVIADGEAGRTVHLLRHTKRQRHTEDRFGKDSLEEFKVNSRQPAVQRYVASTFSAQVAPSSALLREQSQQKRGSGSGTTLTDSSLTIFSSSSLTDLATTSTQSTRLVSSAVSDKLVSPSTPPSLHSLSLAATFSSRAASSSSSTSSLSPTSPASPPTPVELSVSISPSSPHMSPVHSPRQSDVYTISATTVSVSFLRSVPTLDELQHPNPLRLSFLDHPQLEAAFQHEHAAKALKLVRMGFLTFVLCLCAVGAYDTTKAKQPASHLLLWALRLLALLIGLVAVLASYWKEVAFCRWQQLIVGVCWSAMAALQIVITVSFYAAGAGVYGMSIMLILITTTSFFVGLQFRSVCVSILALLLVYLVAEIIADSIQLSVCFLAASAALSMLSAHSSEKIQRLDFIRYLRLNNEERKTRDILDNMLPKGIMTDIVKSQLLGVGYGGSIVAHEIQLASVLFCDIVSFTSIASSSSPEDVVAILNVAFSTFDALTTKHRG